MSNKNPCKDIIHIGANAEEYYHIELICSEDNGIEYGIQAYGEEAKELYKEINWFTMASTPSRHAYKDAEELVENDAKYQEEQEEQEKLKLVKKAIDCIIGCCFDNGCVLMFKKLKNDVYQREKLCLIDLSI